MGSLMSGWSSSVLTDKEGGTRNIFRFRCLVCVLSLHDFTGDHTHVHGAVRLMRNRSLTNDEVEAFWRKHGGRPAAENGEAAAGGSPRAGQAHTTTIPLAARQLKAMRSMPPLRGGMRSDDLCSPCAAGQHAPHLYPASEPASPATTARGKGCFFHGNAAAAAAAAVDDDDDTSSTSRGWYVYVRVVSSCTRCTRTDDSRTILALAGGLVAAGRS